jgi:hypothetical protein
MASGSPSHPANLASVGGITIIVKYQRKILLLLFTLLLMGSCTSPDLQFDESPNALLIDARNTTAGAPEPHSYCNSIPYLTVWGDGRVVKPVFNAVGERQIQIAYATKAKLAEGLHYLASENFFSKWPVESANPSGAGFELKINLKAGSFSQSWNMPGEPRLVREFVSRIYPTDFKPYTPEQALLRVTALQPGASTGSPVIWPQIFDFSLSDVPANGRMINGDVLSFVWQAINQQNVKMIKSVNKNYIVWLVIPEIEMSGLDCP